MSPLWSHTSFAPDVCRVHLCAGLASIASKLSGFSYYPRCAAVRAESAGDKLVKRVSDNPIMSQNQETARWSVRPSLKAMNRISTLPHFAKPTRRGSRSPRRRSLRSQGSNRDADSPRWTRAQSNWTGTSWRSSPYRYGWSHEQKSSAWPYM